MQIALKKQIEVYIDSNGQSPFINWLEALDPPVKFRVKERLDTLSVSYFVEFFYRI